ncbi:MAG: Fic family protein [Bdellovibrionota bacterium]
MKSIILWSIILLQVHAHACDDAIKPFPRDCAIQDRFVALKNSYANRQINIDEIAEYRVIRFVDRQNWERAKTSRIKPEQIYKPAPATWAVWDSGIREVMRVGGAKGQLQSSYTLDESSISYVNKVLLMNEAEHLNVKDKITDQALTPGEYRKLTSTGVGFRSNGKDYSSMINLSEESMNRLQARWETAMGAPFGDLLRDAGVANYAGANLRSGMKDDQSRKFVSYAPSSVVPVSIEWIKNFIRLNLERYKTGNPVLSPMELAAVVQKWFVSIHPFSDGNGRTSRAIQDLILTNFEMPLVPGGDLQDDATAVYEDYLERTYTKTENILSALEMCLTLNTATYHCQTVESIKAMPDAEVRQLQKATKKD